MNLTSVILWSLSALFIKLTLLVLYLRTNRPTGGMKLLIWGVMVVMAVFYGTSIVCT